MNRLPPRSKCTAQLFPARSLFRSARGRDLAFPRRPGELPRREWDRTSGLGLLDELEFRGELRTRLLDTIDPDPDSEPETTAESGFELDGTRLASGSVAAWLEEPASGEDRVGVAVPGAWRRGTGDVQSIALATTRGTAEVGRASCRKKGGQ